MKIAEAPRTDMFDFLKPYRTIVLTGPHRAGTTIASLMIANDLDIELYREKDIACWSGKGEVDLREFLDQVGHVRLVLGCPGLCHTLHHYADVPGLAVVMLIRPIEEILKSQERIRWGFAKLEMRHYPDYEPPVAQAKYQFWRDVQVGDLGDRAFELEYHSLEKHPMWVPKEQRADFTVGQYQVGVPRGPRYQLTLEEWEQAGLG